MGRLPTLTVPESVGEWGAATRVDAAQARGCGSSPKVSRRQNPRPASEPTHTRTQQQGFPAAGRHCWRNRPRPPEAPRSRKHPPAALRSVIPCGPCLPTSFPRRRSAAAIRRPCAWAGGLGGLAARRHPAQPAQGRCGARGPQFRSLLARANAADRRKLRRAGRPGRFLPVPDCVPRASLSRPGRRADGGMW